MKRVAVVGFTFENSDYFAIGEQDLDSFWTDNITESIGRIPNNNIAKIKIAGEIMFSMKKEHDYEYDAEQHGTIFKRFLSNDLISLTVFYEDGSADTLQIEYEDAGGQNANMSSAISDGNLYVCISRSQTVDAAFSLNDPKIKSLFPK